MKRTILACALAGILACLVNAADVEPATATVTLVRDAAPSDVSSAVYYIGTTLKITGTMFAATSTNGAVQDLTDVEIIVNIGNVTQGSNIYTGTVADAVSGTFHVTTVIPTNTSPVNVQYKITDTNGVDYIYPWHNVKVKEAM